jgi:hypothetical protein
MLDLSSLPRLTREILELKESTIPTFERVLEIDMTDELFGIMDISRAKNSQQSFISDIEGIQGSGKSYVGLFECGYIDKNFNAENIFFDFNKLVNNRKELKPHSAVLMDEQTQVFGVDSMRISIIMNAIKDRLRKKNISLIFCSPRLRETHVNSRFVQETLFIDEEMKESYIALKIAQNLQCLGYSVIPHPLSVVSKKLLLEYEKLKDESLDELLSQPVDDVEERAKMIIQDKDFKSAEEVYLSEVGFIPYRTLIQIINRMFPEFKGSVIVYELADRVRLLKELGRGDGIKDFGQKWKIAGKSWEKKKLEGEAKRGGSVDDVPDLGGEEPDREVEHLKMIKKKLTGGGTKSLKKKKGSKR